MNFDQFVKALPEGLVYAPIYAKGARMVSGKPATGKNPLEASYEQKFGPADVALAVNATLTSKLLVSSLASVAMASSSLTLTGTSRST